MAYLFLLWPALASLTECFSSKILMKKYSQEAQTEEIISYNNDLSDIVERSHQAEVDRKLDKWAYDAIPADKGPLRPGMPNYKGSIYNFLSCVNRHQHHNTTSAIIGITHGCL
eukprot:scaffold3224_cov158-Amphora_coffeaeformis.AAC.6